MVEVKSRPQTFYGSENYSGKKIPWTGMSVPVRVRPEVQIKKGGLSTPLS